MEESRDLRSMEEDRGVGIPAEGRGSGTIEERRGFVLLHRGGPWLGTMEDRGLGTMEEGRDLGTMEEDKGEGDHSVQQGLSAATQRGDEGGTRPLATGAHANCSL